MANIDRGDAVAGGRGKNANARLAGRDRTGVVKRSGTAVLDVDDNGLEVGHHGADNHPVMAGDAGGGDYGQGSRPCLLVDIERGPTGIAGDAGIGEFDGIECAAIAACEHGTVIGTEIANIAAAGVDEGEGGADLVVIAGVGKAATAPDECAPD